MIIPSFKQLIVKFVVVSGKVCCGAPSVVGKAHWLEEDFCLAGFRKHGRKKRWWGWLECFYCARQRCNHRIVLVIVGAQKVGRKTEFPPKVVENRGFDEHILSPQCLHRSLIILIYFWARHGMEPSITKYFEVLWHTYRIRHLKELLCNLRYYWVIQGNYRYF